MIRGNVDTYEKLLESAKNEFFEKGFEKSSIRGISSRAGLTIGALYQHFDNKEAVFNEVVSHVYSGFLSLSEKKKKIFMAALEEDIKNISNSITLITGEFLSYIFENWDIFLLLISNEKTEIYGRFFDQIVENEAEMTKLLLNRLNNKKYEGLKLEQIKLITSTQYLGIFALIRSQKDKRELENNLNLLFSFYRSGWEGIINFETS